MTKVSENSLSQEEPKTENDLGEKDGNPIGFLDFFDPQQNDLGFDQYQETDRPEEKESEVNDHEEQTNQNQENDEQAENDHTDF